MLNAALLFSGFGAYFIPLQEQLHWSKTVISGAFSMSRVESGILGPLQGWLIDKLGPRLVIQLGAVILGLGFMMFSQVHSVLAFYLTFLLMAIGSSLAGYLAISTSIINWFDKKRATAMGIASAGMGVGGLMVPAVAWSISSFGWRPTAFFSGVVIIAVFIPMARLIRFRPEEYGYLPDGEPRRGFQTRGIALSGPSSSGSLTEEIPTSFTARQAMKTSSFWLLSLGHGSALFAVSAMSLHLIPFVVDTVGVSVQVGASVVAVMTAFTLFGQFGGGFVSDRVSKRVVVVICMLGHAIALLGLAFVSTLGPIMALAALHGLCWGVRGPLMATMRAEYFGRRSFATIMGFSSIVVMIGMTTGTLIAGYTADVFGSYRWGFVIIAGLVALGSLFFVFARKPDLSSQTTKRRARFIS